LPNNESARCITQKAKHMDTSDVRPSITPGKIAKIAGGVVVSGVLLSVITDSFFTVPQTDRCYITQFKKPIAVNDGPIGSGLHFKLPWMQGVDCISVSRNTDQVGIVNVTTKDTFTLKLRVGITTEIPDASVYRLLYQTGKQGNYDIATNINPNIINALRNTMGKHDLMQIAGEDRERTLGEFKTEAETILRNEWGIDVKEVQVSIEELPPEYNQRMVAAQSAQAAIVLAQRQQQQAKIEAETKVIAAQGDASMRAAQAEGERRQTETVAAGNATARKLQAEAEAAAIRMQGEAQAEASTKMADALAKNPALVALEQARRWDGKLPDNMYAGVPLPFMNVSSGK